MNARRLTRAMIAPARIPPRAGEVNVDENSQRIVEHWGR
jgi:hypothetical protein